MIALTKTSPNFSTLMNSQDRELLEALNLRHERLENAVALLKTDLRVFATRLDAPVAPPRRDISDAEEHGSAVAAARRAAVGVPPAQEFTEPAGQRPAATSAPQLPLELPPLPKKSEEPTPEGPGLEIQFGRWLARLGVVFALLTLIFFSVVAYKDYYQYIGPWTKLAILTLVSAAMIAGGMFLERSVRVYGRTLAGGGMACLYYTIYGATYVDQLKVNPSPLFGGFLLLVWSAAVLTLAERRKSELLSIFAISLAYFSSAITPVGGFTMVADLLLALTAVVFLVRNAWTGLSYLCLIGTYLGFVRQIVLDAPQGPFGFDFVHELDFRPSATYLTGAWLIFTAGIFLAKTETFARGKRMAFLCLNNGAWVGLLIVAAQLSGYGHVGGMLCLAGALLLGRRDAGDLANAYLTQGLAIATGGVVIAYSGVTRGLIVTVESVFLAAAGAYSRNGMLRLAGGVAALLSTAFLLDETVGVTPFPWWLTCIGAAAMAANAGLARLGSPREVPSGFAWLSGYYVALALMMIVRWIYGVVPMDEITLSLFALATLLIGAGLFGKGTVLIRAGFVLDVAGIGNYFGDSVYPLDAMTWMNLGAFVLFLAQPALLRRWGREIVSHAESWGVLGASSAMGWLFVSHCISALGSHNLTLGWALFALALILIGFASNERRQRWCGLAILAAAFVRVAVHDFWGFSDGYKVLTFFALTVICLGLSFLYYKFAERLKEWL
jgi:hypothetical protein